MKIEVACKAGSTTKDKGDLLENLTQKLLKIQNYKVIEEIRTVGAELDLLCKHEINGKEIYVECKAQKENIQAKILRQLWGTVEFEDFAEGWIVSTSEFTKDAKGFIHKWKSRDKEKATRLSFYGPVEIIETLQRAKIIIHPPELKAQEFIDSSFILGDWVLLVSDYGIFWCIYVLKDGTPVGVLVYQAENGKHIYSLEALENLSKLDTPLATFDLKLGASNLSDSPNYLPKKLPIVVQVQIGESWLDYRPARPIDFVGRDKTQKDILSFLESAKTNVGTRIFSITGNSGLGKSSLIAKIRDRSRNQFYRNKYFVYAVDIRGASEPTYIVASLLSALKEAQSNGFGTKDKLSLTNPSSPFNSPSIKSYLSSLKNEDKVICLIFDQFEELYSKPELYGIFKAAKSLMLDVAGLKGNFVLGFAWKTDSTTHQDHPAYHLWHELSDHRKNFELDVFNSGEIANSLTKFEKAVDFKMPPDTRYQITQICQGYPWLLKKLCKNVFETIDRGESASNALFNLDIKRLFEADLNLLTPQELTCLRLIAQKAPAEWSEIIEISGPTTLNALVNKRLIIKSGDRLNVYWDIFKDFLLNDKVPIVPFNYIPSTDLTSLINVCKHLKLDDLTDSNSIGLLTGLNEKTVWNIGADLVMLGIAERQGTTFKISNKLSSNNEELILKLLRSKLDQHSLKLSLFKSFSGQTISNRVVKKTLKDCIPNAKFSDKTWNTYTNRLTRYLISCGYMSQAGSNYIVQDLGSINPNKSQFSKRHRQRTPVFSITVSPKSVLEGLSSIPDQGYSTSNLKQTILSALRRFELVDVMNSVVNPRLEVISKAGGNKEAIWVAAKNEKSFQECAKLLEINPEINSRELAEEMNRKYELNWSDSSILRNGSILKQWSSWVLEGINSSDIPEPK